MQVNYSYSLWADVVLRMSPRSFTAIKKFEKFLNLSSLPLKQNALLSEYINIDNFEPCPLSLNIFLSLIGNYFCVLSVVSCCKSVYFVQTLLQIMLLYLLFDENIRKIFLC